MNESEALQSFIHSYSSRVLTVRGESTSPVTKPYLISHPVAGKILAIRISIVSRDSSLTTKDAKVSTTWFDATILRPIVSAGDGKSRLPSPPFAADTTCCSKPSDIADKLEQQGWKLVDTVPCDGVFRVCVNSISAHWETHEILWNAASASDTDKNPGATFLDTLKEGDRIVIWARAKCANQINHAKHARIEVTVAEPSLVGFRNWLPRRYDPGRVSKSSEDVFFGSIGTFIDTGLSDEEVFEKHGFRWSIEESRSQNNASGKPQLEGKAGWNSRMLALKSFAVPSDPCASCGLPVSHQFSACTNCQQLVCMPCQAAGKMANHYLTPQLVFNQNVDGIVKGDKVIEDAASTTARRLRNEHYADYEPLNRDAKEIRLLSVMPSEDDDEPLSCVMTTTTISASKMNYMALSYCWGDMEKQRNITISSFHENSEDVPIFGPFNPFRVTENLFNALKSIRRTLRAQETPPPSARLWVDALCINQSDNKERAHQVSIMDQIYANAGCVWIWIGDGEEIQKGIRMMKLLGSLVHEVLGPTAFHLDSDASLTAMREIHDFELTNGEIQYGPADFVSAFCHVLRQPWFKRIWVLQEVFRARGPVNIYAGPNHLVEFDTVLFANHFSAYNKTLSDGWGGSTYGFIPFAWKNLSAISHQRNGDEPVRGGLMTLVGLFRETYYFFDATDSRDKLFALLGLAEEISQRGSSASKFTVPARLAVDYAKPISQVFCDFTLWCIEHYRNLDILSVVGETTDHFCPSYRCPAHPDSGHDTDRPSWALWHRGKSYKICQNIALGKHPFDVSSKRDVDVAALQSSSLHTLPLKGVRVGTVKSINNGVLSTTMMDEDTRMEFYVFNYRTYRNLNCPLKALWGMVKEGRACVEGEPFYDWLGHSYSAYKGDEEAMFRDFLETIMLRNPEPGKGNIWEEEEIAHRLAVYWKQHDPELQTLPPSVRKSLEPLVKEEAKWGPHDGFPKKVPSHGKHLFMSDGWRLGLCPPETETGDVIVVLFGGKVPFILRPKQSAPLPGQTDGQEWEFIGECFVHGQMHSGVVDEKLRQNVPIENFHLV